MLMSICSSVLFMFGNENKLKLELELETYLKYIIMSEKDNTKWPE